MREERRRFIRTTTRLLTFYKVPSTGQVRRALTRDISGGGLSCVTETLLKPGTALEVEVKLPDRETPITFTVEVVWSKPVGGESTNPQNQTAETGMKIVKINPKDQTLLVQYATLHAPPS